MKQVKFNQQLEAQNNLDIESISNCCIRASNDLEYYYYLIIKTIAGKTYFAECGPILKDSDRLPSGFINALLIFEYNERKLLAMINGFLNDKSKKVTEASVVDIDEALNNFKNLKEFMEGLYNDKNTN